MKKLFYYLKTLFSGWEQISGLTLESEDSPAH